jgi:hypothetical protein
MCVVRHKSHRWRGHTPCGSDAEDEAHGARQAQRAAAPGAARVRRRAQLAAACLNIAAAWVAAARLGNTNRVVGRQSGRPRPAGVDSAAQRPPCPVSRHHVRTVRKCQPWTDRSALDSGSPMSAGRRAAKEALELICTLSKRDVASEQRYRLA